MAETEDYRYQVRTRHAQSALVSQVMESGVLGGASGRMVGLLEEHVGRTTGAENVAAVATGTLAFEAVTRALSLQPGEEVIVPEVGWVSIAATVELCGLHPVPVAVGRSCMLTPEDIVRAIRPSTRAVVVAHLFGTPAPRIAQTARLLATRGIALVEDCAQAWGARYLGQHVGTFGDGAFLSTQAHKLVSTGEGGIAILSDRLAMDRLRIDIGDMRFDPGRPVWRRNMRMTEIVAAVAIPQIADLERLLETLGRACAAMRGLLEADEDVESVGPNSDADVTPNGATLVAWTRNAVSGDRVVKRLASQGLRSWRLLQRSDDLHHARNWPTGAPHALVDWSSLVIIPVPACDVSDILSRQ